MDRTLRKKLTVYNNRIKQNIEKAYNTKKTISPLTFTNYYSYSNRQYDNIMNIITKYLMDNYKQIYFDERWKQIIIAKRLNRMLRGIDFRKEKDTYNINQYIKGIINDINTAITNGKRERYLNLRLIELRNKQNIQAFLEEDEIEDIIHNAETYPDARNILINKLLEYSDDGQTVVVDIKGTGPLAGGVRHYDIKYYTDMVLRTAIREIQTTATIDAANEVGADLVEVSVHNTVCPICYSKDTEIYTKDGWKLIKNITKKDIVITFNKEENKIEWNKVKKIIKGYANELINFKGKQLDIQVTKNHNMLYQNDYKARYNKNKYDIKKAEDLLNDNYGRFYAGCTIWKGNRIGFDYAEFMGYYLSEGSVYKNSDKSYVINITQSRNVNKFKYRKIKKCCEKYLKWLPIRDRNNGISFNSIKLGKYLKQFGKAYEKYIPDNIMNADKECIRIFLDAYCLGDGNIKKSKWGDYYSKSYITSSKKMADQLTELILKVGKRPTYRLVKTSGKVQKFKNGYYTINRDTHIIYESKNIYLRLNKLDKNLIKYNDNVYCIQAEKNNVIYIRRNGKPIWCGNCIPFEGKIYSIDGKNPLFPPLDDSPPYHPNPYDKKTKVLTKDKGWVYIKDVEIGDICLSLNKYTKEIEYAKVTKLYKFLRNKMIRFKSKTVDIVVSKEHQMLISDKKLNTLIDANELLNRNYNKYNDYFVSNGFNDNFIYYSLKKINKQIIDYNDYAYCVELEKNHVLYVSRNGKCIWSGNCLHSLTVIFESVLHRRGNIDDYMKFSRGELEQHPTARGWIPISQRKIV